MLAFATPALGLTFLDDEAEPNVSPKTTQVRHALPFDLTAEDVFTCGECAHFRPGAGAVGRCELRGFCGRGEGAFLRVVRRARAV